MNIKYKLIISLLFGLFISIAVLVLNYFEINGFCIKTGFWGTHYLDSFFYALDSNYSIMSFIALLYFSIAFLLIFALLLPMPAKGD